MRTRALALALGVVAIAACGSSPSKPVAQNLSDDELRQMFCPTGGCREAHVVKLRKPDGSLFIQGPQLTYPPVQLSGMVTVFPGESFAFTGRIENGQLVDRRLVTDADGDVPRISVDFEQMDDGGMMLTISSSFDQPVKYTLGMMRFGDDMPRHTSTCPLQPGLPVFEMWPHPIYQLFVTDIALVAPDSKAANTCE